MPRDRHTCAGDPCIVAFTAYYWRLDRYPATIVATHTYVNPAVAIVLGWAIGGEAMSSQLILGLIVITSAIALVGTSAAEDAKTISHSTTARAPRLRES